MIVKLLIEHHLEFLSLKGGCRGSSESTLVKISNCWKSHAAAHMSRKRMLPIYTIQHIGNGVHQKVQVGMCAHQRLRSSCAFVKSDWSL